MEGKKTLKHVAFIMDGNGRWAKARKLPRHLGHKEGCERIIEIYDECLTLGIEVMSLYAFSTENWNRPQDEINHLFNYLEIFFKKYQKRLIKDNAKVVISGDISRLPLKTQNIILKTLDLTKNGERFVFNICLNYGGKAEIIRACKLFAEDVVAGKTKVEDLNETTFENYLYTKGLPMIDLLIRTSGEERTSNFFPYQLAYSEFIFTKTLWPDFTKEEFHRCLDIFSTRTRTFGEIHDK